MKYLIVPIALAVGQVSAASDEWVSVGARPAVTNASTPAKDPLPVQSSNVSNNTASAGPADSGLIAELLMQVEQMQQEIATLRGIVESQANDIRRLNQESEARYLDLDRRLVAVTAVKEEAKEAPEENAQDAYKAAMALVREKKFEEASAAFEAFVQKWPEDELKANALYWAGEVFLVRRDPDSASNRFREVIDTYPNHIKAPDATYKYAMTLHKLGDADAARHWLETLISRYEGSADTTVQLARAYLKKLPESGAVGKSEKN